MWWRFFHRRRVHIEHYEISLQPEFPNGIVAMFLPLSRWPLYPLEALSGLSRCSPSSPGRSIKILLFYMDFVFFSSEILFQLFYFLKYRFFQAFMIIEIFVTPTSLFYCTIYLYSGFLVCSTRDFFFSRFEFI